VSRSVSFNENGGFWACDLRAHVLDYREWGIQAVLAADWQVKGQRGSWLTSQSERREGVRGMTAEIDGQVENEKARNAYAAFLAFR
jgi:hypothetical protein